MMLEVNVSGFEWFLLRSKMTPKPTIFNSWLMLTTKDILNKHQRNTNSRKSNGYPEKQTEFIDLFPEIIL